MMKKTHRSAKMDLGCIWMESLSTRERKFTTSIMTVINFYGKCIEFVSGIWITTTHHTVVDTNRLAIKMHFQNETPSHIPEFSLCFRLRPLLLMKHAAFELLKLMPIMIQERSSCGPVMLLVLFSRPGWRHEWLVIEFFDFNVAIARF